MENKHKEFKPFDRVLVKYGKVWVVDFYRNYVESTNIHLTLTGTSYDNDILPYEGNEHLVGKVDEPEEEVKLKKGECVIYFDESQDLDRFDLFLSRFEGVTGSQIVVSTKFPTEWHYAIRFSDFNPDDMEETRKHILCVKDGKIIRYKE